MCVYWNYKLNMMLRLWTWTLSSGLSFLICSALSLRERTDLSESDFKTWGVILTFASRGFLTSLLALVLLRSYGKISLIVAREPMRRIEPPNALYLRYEIFLALMSFREKILGRLRVVAYRKGSGQRVKTPPWPPEIMIKKGSELVWPLCHRATEQWPTIVPRYDGKMTSPRLERLRLTFLDKFFSMINWKLQQLWRTTCHFGSLIIQEKLIMKTLEQDMKRLFHLLTFHLFISSPFS